MTNLSQLESQWKVYKAKEQKPYIIALASLSIVFILITVFLAQDNKVIKKAVPKKDKNITQSVTVLNPAKLPKITKKVKELTPSFDFMKNIKSEKTKKVSIKHKVHKTKKRNYKKEEIYKEPTRQANTKKHLSVNASSAKNKILKLAERFNSNRDPNLGILVAKQYLLNKEYKKAYFYALEVNTINRKNEESWIITAKALYFLKNKQEALKLLNTYLRKNSSAEAIRVYRAIKQGRLK